MSTRTSTTIRIGSITIDRVEEFSAPVLPADAFLVGLPPDGIRRNLSWLAPDHVEAASELMVMADHTWVLRTPDAVVLIDTCWGNGKDRPGFGADLQTDWLESLRDLGVEPEDVDFVICTHLHSDHVGWNTRLQDGVWVPTFPRARYVVSRLEYEFWEHSDVSDFGHDKAFIDSVVPIAEAGLLDLVESGHTVAGVLTIESAPGHSPGQVIVRAESGGETGIFAADTIHVAVQLAFPDVSTVACVDPELASRVRRTLLDECADKGHLLLTNHFPSPSVCRIEREGDHYRKVTADA